MQNQVTTGPDFGIGRIQFTLISVYRDQPKCCLDLTHLQRILKPQGGCSEEQSGAGRSGSDDSPGFQRQAIISLSRQGCQPHVQTEHPPSAASAGQEFAPRSSAQTPGRPGDQAGGPGPPEHTPSPGGQRHMVTFTPNPNPIYIYRISLS